MNPPPRLAPQAGPSVWTGAALTPADWMVPVGTEAAAELEAARRPGRTRAGRPGDAALPAAPVLRDVAERLEHGRGFCCCAASTSTGWPIRRPRPRCCCSAPISAPRCRRMPPGRWSAGWPGRAPRRMRRCASMPTRRMRWRCSACSSRAEGGRVTLVSAPALHNALLKSDRAALAVLHGGLPHATAAARPLQLPVFSTASGSFVGRYDRDAMGRRRWSRRSRRRCAALEATAARAGPGAVAGAACGRYPVPQPASGLEAGGGGRGAGGGRGVPRIAAALAVDARLARAAGEFRRGVRHHRGRRAARRGADGAGGGGLAAVVRAASPGA